MMKSLIALILINFITFSNSALSMNEEKSVEHLTVEKKKLSEVAPVQKKVSLKDELRKRINGNFKENNEEHNKIAARIVLEEEDMLREETDDYEE